MKLQIWRSDRPSVILKENPSGEEEARLLFGENPIDVPTDLNDLLLLERKQDMEERKVFADRAFLVTLIWVIFLVLLPFFQMACSFWDKGLSDQQFIAVVTSTTGSVFGFWYLVGRYLFPNKAAGEKSREKKS